MTLLQIITTQKMIKNLLHFIFSAPPLHPIRACLYITNKKDRDEMSWSFLHAYYQLKRLIL